MKLLHIISDLKIGGAQRLLSDLIPLQKEQGISVTLLVIKFEENELSRKIQKAGVDIISLDSATYRNPLLIFKIRRIIKKFDIVHVHLVHGLYFCAFATFGTNIKLVYTEHSTSNNRRGKSYLRGIEKFVYGRYSKIASISKQTQDALQSWLQSRDKRFVIVNNGVDISSFSSVKHNTIPYSLIMVSRFASSKDQETVIRAMQFIDSRARLRFVGDGDNLELCKHLAKELHVDKRIEFLGSRSDIAELVAESYIGIQSSNWEGFGLTAVEIMSCGKPVIASNVDGLKQVVDGAGILFEKGNTYNLAEIVNLLLNDRSYYNSLAKKCIERAKEYDIHKMVDRYESLYNSIL